MISRLLRSIITGLVVAALLLTFVPAIRLASGLKPINFGLSFSAKPLSYNDAVQRAAPAVVNVYNSSINSSRSNLEINSLGSGVIMNSNGYILTNQHVIANAERIIITLQSGRTFEAQLVGSDLLTDLAVLKIQADNLPVIPINPNRELLIGDVVLAIGNPYNLGQTVTQGIISATGRIGLSPYMRQNFLQTDASINRGNSGGALINSLGELVGINTLSLNKSNQGESPEGIGFAIPVALASKVMDKLIKDGRVIRGYIGIEPSFNYVKGILVSQVQTGSPAELAGIIPGDILLEVNNKPASSILEVMDQVAEIAPGTEIPVKIQRRGNLMTVKVTIVESPPITE
jgi:serine protease DegS